MNPSRSSVGFEASDRSGIAHWWATPVLMYRWPDCEGVNRDLEGLVRERMTTSASRVRSNIGGWHSDDDLLTWPGSAPAQLKEWIAAGVRELCRVVAPDQALPKQLRIVAWANANRAGDSNAAHEHGNHSWSGVYYVSTGMVGDVADSGQLELRDPRDGAGRINVGLASLGASNLVPPRPGLMVMFPSWLLHGVRPHAGPDLRISVAFNVAELP